MEGAPIKNLQADLSNTNKKINDLIEEKKIVIDEIKHIIWFNRKKVYLLITITKYKLQI